MQSTARPEGPKSDWSTEQREAHLAGWQRQRLGSGPERERYPEALRGFWDAGHREAAEPAVQS